MKRGKGLGTFVVLVGLVVAGLAAKNLFRGHSAAAKSQNPSTAGTVSVRAKAAQTVAATRIDPADSQATELTNKLFRSTGSAWDKPIAEEAFASFHDWAEKFLATDPSRKVSLEEEGIELAKI